MRTQARFLTIGLLVLAGLAVIGPGRPSIAQWWYEQTKPTELPAPTIVETPDPQTSSTPVSEPEDQTTSNPDSASPNGESSQSSITNHQSQITSLVPKELNLAVPFTSQAPHGNWDVDHEEYCEEASVLMVARFFASQPITGPDDADAAMTRLKMWQVNQLGHFESTTAAETAQMAEGNFALDVTLSTDVSEQSIKQALANGQLVILPAAGRELGNPYFQRPGPIYHMLVVKGYTTDGHFITNDPGTRRGADFVYPADQLLDAVGDYNQGDPANGETVMLVVGPRS